MYWCVKYNFLFVFYNYLHNLQGQIKMVGDFWISLVGVGSKVNEVLLSKSLISSIKINSKNICFLYI